MIKQHYITRDHNGEDICCWMVALGSLGKMEPDMELCVIAHDAQQAIETATEWSSDTRDELDPSACSFVVGVRLVSDVVVVNVEK